MTHKDYVAIAGALATARARSRGQDMRAIDLAIHAVADALAADNPRFDRQRFYEAAIGQPRNGRDRPQ